MNPRDLMSRYEMQDVYPGYQPGHTEPVGLRVLMGHDLDSFIPAPVVLRTHGTAEDAIVLVSMLTDEGFDLDWFQMDGCAATCTHTYWRAPDNLTPDHVRAALSAMDGDHPIPDADAIAPLGMVAPDFSSDLTARQFDTTTTEVPLLDVGGYLACGCHGSQSEHTCTDND
jgi:hypothetical protein